MSIKGSGSLNVRWRKGQFWEKRNVKVWAVENSDTEDHVHDQKNLKQKPKRRSPQGEDSKGGI